MLIVKVEDLGEVVILRCAGRIVRGDETGLLCEAARRYGREIILDLSQVEAMDAAGIGLLISLQAAGIYLRLLNPTKQVRETLRVTKVDSVLEISESRPEEAAPAGLPLSLAPGSSPNPAPRALDAPN